MEWDSKIIDPKEPSSSFLLLDSWQTPLVQLQKQIGKDFLRLWTVVWMWGKAMFSISSIGAWKAVRNELDAACLCLPDRAGKF